MPGVWPLCSILNNATRRDWSFRNNTTQRKKTPATESAERAGVHTQADLEEKAAHEPPRLGRHRYKAERPQVLTSDNVTGCLRTLRTVPQVAKDRFKSLQKRGVLQVCPCQCCMAASMRCADTAPFHVLGADCGRCWKSLRNSIRAVNLVMACAGNSATALEEADDTAREAV